MAFAPGLVAVGGKITASFLNAIIGVLSPPTTYAATLNNWTSTPAPATTARYWIVGNMCHVIVQSKLGGSTVTVGSISLTLPVAMDVIGAITESTLLVGSVGMNDVSTTTEYVGAVRVIDANTVRILRPGTSTAGVVAPTNSTQPMTWQVSDELSIDFWYPIA